VRAEDRKLIAFVCERLRVSESKAAEIVSVAERLYKGRMRERFSELKVCERLKRTNPFLLRIRGLRTVAEWATTQVTSALFASEEEAVGHVLEAIAKCCHPNATAPTYPDDFDYEVAEGNDIVGYQVKMSWDCMPMSSRKNLSNTIRKVRETHKASSKDFIGVFAPCYGKATTSSPPGQEYVAMGSREFWSKVGAGDRDFDVRVGDVCALLCSEFRQEINSTLVPTLIEKLTIEAMPLIGGNAGQINYPALFRAINR